MNFKSKSMLILNESFKIKKKKNANFEGVFYNSLFNKGDWYRKGCVPSVEPLI